MAAAPAATKTARLPGADGPLLTQPGGRAAYATWLPEETAASPAFW